MEQERQVTDELRVIKVVWIDPHSIDEWMDAEEACAGESCKIISIGIYVKETDDRLVMALNFDPAGDGISCTMILPKACILSVQEIAYVKNILETESRKMHE
jgi:hypothetical protein